MDPSTTRNHRDPTPPSVRTRFRTPAYALGLVVAALLLAALLVPLAGAAQEESAQEPAPTAAETADPVIPDETPVVEETPIPDETPDAEETPDTEETSVPEGTPDADLTSDPDDPLTSSISVVMRACPSLYGGDLQQLSANCQPVGDIPFEVSGGGVLQDYGRGDFLADELPAGRYTIRQDLPKGYSSPLALCDIAPTGTGFVLAEVDVTAGFYEFELGQDESIACSWFHTEGGDASAAMSPRFCPADFDAADAGHADFAAACLAEQDGVAFRVYKDDPAIRTAKTSGSPSRVGWDDLPTDYQLSFTMERQEGYGQVAVFCNLNGSGYQRVNTLQQSPLNSSFALTLLPGETLSCDWYNLPATGRLTVYRLVCPEDADFDYAAASADDLGDRCKPDETEGVGFDLTSQATGETETQYTDTDPNGGGTVGAHWEEARTGAVTATEHVRDGFGTPRVFCGIAGVGGIVPIDVAVEGRSADFYLPSGAFVLCDWFDIPEDAPDVYVQKWFCPEDDEVDYYAEDLDFFMATTNPCELYEGGEVSFDLYSHASDTTETRSTGATGIAAAVWETVPAGDVTVTEEGWDGYGTPVVFCGTASGSDYDAFPVEVAGRSADFAIPSGLDEGYDVVCNWYNIPEDDGSVTVVKYDCPAGTGGGLGGFDRYDVRCDEPAEGVSFKLDGDRTGNPGSRETDADGVAIWGDREADRYVLSEDVPAGYGTPVVYCDTDAPLAEQPPDFAPFAVDGDARIEFGLGEGQAILCVWFNIPTNDDDRGTPNPSSTPTPPGKVPVTKLPSTGSGAVDAASRVAGTVDVLSAIWLLVAAGLVLASANSADRRTRRSRSASRPTALGATDAEPAHAHTRHP